jgi:DNA-binding SARP family transcriptional activator/tetratricopeptide (TPR) repeat protein
MLLLHANQRVSRDQLIAALWPQRQPRSADGVLRTYVSGLRHTAGLSQRDSLPRLAAVAGGYRLDVALADLDLLVFADLAAQGRRALQDGQADRAAGLLRDALALWRGHPAEDVHVDSDTEALLARLVELRLSAEEAWIDAELALRHEADLIPRLRALVGEHPLRERLWAQLIAALHRVGRRAEALTAFHELRGHLISELGLEPGPHVQALQQQILAGDEPEPEPAGEKPLDDWSGGGHALVPRLLPAAIPGFVARELELASLDELLAWSAGASRPAAVVAVLSGLPGVGKTSLAVHWAHRVAAQFPDGQLHADMNGFGPGGRPTTPDAAIRRFLDAFGVPPEHIPADPAAQADLYRSLLATRRVLVLLDNARDIGQVRPLLPAAPGCAAVVTSRDQLIGLVTGESAQLLTVDVLAPAEARQLLAARLGRHRVRNEAQAASDIVSHCGGLPLALALVAARATAHPQFPLAAIAAELNADCDVLSALDAVDPAMGPHAVFSWSYRQLSPPAARLFCLAGLHPGTDLSVPATASLLSATTQQARSLLAELTRVNLATEHRPGRYTMHDLLRAYAAEQAHTTVSDTERRAAMHRTLDHYLHTAHAAALLLQPARTPLPLHPAQPGSAAERITSEAHALAWMRAEHPVLLQTVTRAASDGFPIHAWQLAWTLVTFLHRQGRWQDLITTQRAAAAAAASLADRSAQAHSARGLGRALALLGSCDEARARLLEALGLFTQLGDHVHEGHTELDLGQVAEQQGLLRDAIEHCSRALALYRATGTRSGEADALNNIGWFHIALGENQQGAARCKQALELYRELGESAREAAAWDSLGCALHHLGTYPEALHAFRQAISLHRKSGDRALEASSLSHIGDTLQAVDSPERARDAWQQALAILEELGHPDAPQIRARLNHPAPTAAG